jgi:NADPH:quinone reductase-like Zn-dependent oxidoreductase
MRALVLRENSFQVEDLPSPVAEASETHLRVLACALNHRDQYIREGLYSKIKLPAVLGNDVCGLTDDGERVVVDASMNWGDDPRAQGPDFHLLGMPTQGGLAEEICVPTANIYPAPSLLSDEEVACLPVGGATAYRAMFTRGGLQAGQTVLITGIGGGVAALALVFAQAAGARILVSSRSEAKLERAAEFGAEPLDPKRDKNSVDLVIDSIGGDTLTTLFDVARPGGTVVLYGASAGAGTNVNLHRLFWKQLNVLGSSMGTPRDFVAMLEFVSRHEIRPIIDSLYTLDEYTAAFERIRNYEQFGKIVVRL